MEMDKLGVVTTFIHNIVVYNIPLLYGTVGEIMVEKSGSLNLGVEGIMAVGAIFGYIVGCYAACCSPPSPCPSRPTRTLPV